MSNGIASVKDNNLTNSTAAVIEHPVRYLVFQALIKAFEGSCDTSTATIKAVCSVDQDNPASFYPHVYLRQLIRYFWQSCEDLRGLGLSELMHEIGYRHGMGFTHNTLEGRLRYQVFKDRGGWQMLQNSSVNHNLLMPFGQRTLQKTGVGRATLTIEDDPSNPYYIIGLLKGLMEAANTTELVITYQTIGEGAWSFQLSWKDQPLPG